MPPVNDKIKSAALVAVNCWNGEAESLQMASASANYVFRFTEMFCRWRLVYMFLVYARKWGFGNLSAPQAVWFAKKRENIARGYTWQI